MPSPSEPPRNPLLDDPLLKDVRELAGYRVLGGCMLCEWIGEGGMGVVYRAWQVDLARHVAVKCIRREQASTKADPKEVLRFEKEARLAARVTNSNLVTIHAVNVRGPCGVPHMIMEYVHGESAHDRVYRRRSAPQGKGLDSSEALAIVLGAAQGLAAAHAARIVHRDIKPVNILVSFAGEVKLADLGLAKAHDGDGSTQAQRSPSAGGTRIAGSVPFMPPEQWESLSKVGPPGNVWALGATLFYLLTETAPKPRELGSALPGKLKKLRPDLPDALIELLRRCTEQEPKDRYSDGAALVVAVKALTEHEGLHASLQDLEAQRDHPLPPRPPKESLDVVRRRVAADPTAIVVASTESRRAPVDPRRSRAALVLVVPALAGALGLGLLATGCGWFGGGSGASDTPGVAEGIRLIRTANTLDDGVMKLEEELRIDSTRDRAKAPLARGLEAQAERSLAAKRYGDAIRRSRRALELEPGDTEIEGLHRRSVEVARADLDRGLVIESPPEGKLFAASTIEVRGRLDYQGGYETVEVTADGRSVELVAGRLRWTLSKLADGPRAVQVTARVEDEVEVTKTRGVTVDTAKPKLLVLAPQPDAWVQPGAEIQGTVEDATDVAVLVDGDEATVDAVPAAGSAARAWRRTLGGTGDGERTVTVRARDAAGNESEAVRLLLHADGTEPVLDVLEPLEGAEVEPGRLVVRGLVRDAAPASVAVNGKPAMLTADGWSADVEIREETTRLDVEARDLAGNKASAARRVSVRRIPGVTFLKRNAQGYAEYSHQKTGIVLVLLPGGTFTMGGTAEEKAGIDEKPRHAVTLSPFLIAKYEVTQAEWERIVVAAKKEGKLTGLDPKPSDFAKGGVTLPVEQVSWEHCEALCTVAGLTLPTEAQWEYACRAGSDTPIPSGELRILGIYNSPDLDAIAWYGGNSAATYEGAVDASAWPEKQHDHARAGPQPVGKKQPNAFGLHDTIGNVYEWCADVYDAEFYKKAAATEKDPKCAAGSANRVLRGGSWNFFAWFCRSAFRFGDAASGRGDYAGFRPALSLPSE